MDRKTSVISNILSLLKIIRVIKLEHPDIIQAYNTVPSFLAKISWFFYKRSSLIVTYTGLGSLYIFNNNKYKIYRFIYEKINRLLKIGIKISIFQNNDDFELFYKKKLIGHRYSIVPGSGVDIDYFNLSHYKENNKELIKNKYLKENKKIVITSIGRLVKSKGVLELARIADLIKIDQKEVIFVFIGPDDKDSIDHINIKEIDFFSQRVIWLGEMTQAEIRDILYITDIFIFMSYREGLPRALIEAGSMCIPSVVFNAPGSREIIKDGYNGFIVNNEIEAYKKIKYLIENRDILKLLGKNARRRIEQEYSLTAISRQMTQIYNNILMKRKAR